MEKYKSFYFFLFLSLNASLGAFLIGYFLVVYNTLQTQIQYILYENSSSTTKTIYESLITAAIPLGGCFGSLFSSQIFKILGRKNSLIFIDVVCFLGTILTIFESLSCIILGRFICGFSCGVNSSLLGLYVKEITPIELGDYFCSLLNIVINFGILIAFFFGLNVISDADLALGYMDDWWKFMFAFPMIFCFLRSFFILWKFNYETPIHLLQTNNFDEALNVIKQLYNEEYVDEIYQELSTKSNEIKQMKFRNDESLKENFKQKHLLNFLIAMSLVFASQFCGILGLGFYSSKLFKSSGLSNTVSNYLNIVIGILNLIAGLLMAIPLKHFGIRATYLLSLFFVAVFLALISLCSYFNYSIGTIVSVFLYEFFFNMGCGPMLFIVFPIILPDLLIGISFLVFWFYSFIIGLCFPWMIESSLGISGSFLFFFVCVVVSLVFNFFYLKLKKVGDNVEESDLIEKK